MDYLTLRLLSAFFTGVIISQTGSFIQMGTRNILASPSTLGFDGLAILWVLVVHSLTLYLDQEFSALSFVFLGFPLFLGIGWYFSGMLKGKSKFERPILLGLTFNLLVGAIFSLWQFLFLAFNLPFPVELWFGHFRFVQTSFLFVLFGVELLIFCGYFFLQKDFLLYSLGSSIAQNWKHQEKRFFIFLFTAVALGTFIVVSLFGAFSFLGLIFPIVARKLWFKNKDLKGELLWGSFLNGLILMTVDFLCYFFPIHGAEIPVGLIVSSLGALGLGAILYKSFHRETLAKI